MLATDVVVEVVAVFCAIGTTTGVGAGFFFGSHQNVTGADPFGFSQLLGFVSINGFDFLIGNLGTDDLAQIAVTQGLGLIGGKAALVIVGVGNAFLIGKLGQQVPFHQKFNDKGIAQLGR